MKLGIPTLCRYDLLHRLLVSAEAGSVKPSSYIIIDNGGMLSKESLPFANVELIKPGRNIGVAASWNWMLDLAVPDPIVISNDDVVFNEHTFRDMMTGTENHPFVEGDGWCLFAQTPECTKKIGYYDEHFWPAYYEDSDFDVRMQRANMPRHRALTQPLHHEGWATTRQLGDANWLRDGREQCRQYFLRKWGQKMLGEDPIETFTKPWGGHPPHGYRLRAPDGFVPLKRYDILNKIAFKIGAKRYLEIGVSNGDNINRIKVPERWGVDPNPTPGGLQGATVFIPATSFQFLRTAPDPFDLVFIDGDHTAEVVMREVAEVPLTEKGIIVLHDASPSTESMQTMPCHGGEWTGDVWKAVAGLRAHGYEISTIDTDYGVAIVTNRPTKRSTVECPDLSWGHLNKKRTGVLGLVDPFAFEEWLIQI